MVKIIFDTNFLIDLFRYRVDLDQVDSLFNEEYHFFTLDLVIHELKSIANSRKNSSKFAKLALNLIEKKGFNILKSKENKVDEAIVDKTKEGYLVATNDMELRKKLKLLNTKTIYLRSRKLLSMS